MASEVLCSLASIMLSSHYCLFSSYLRPHALSQVPPWEKTAHNTLNLLFWCLCIIFLAGPSALEFYFSWSVRQTSIHPPRPNSNIIFSVKPSMAPSHTTLNICSLMPSLPLVLTTVTEMISRIVLLLSVCICVFPISPRAAWGLDFIYLCNSESNLTWHITATQ